MTTFNNKEVYVGMWVLNRLDGHFYEVSEILPHIIQLKQIVLTEQREVYYTGQVQFIHDAFKLICID